MFKVRVFGASEEDQKAYGAFLQRAETQDHLTFFHSWEWGEVIRGRSIAFERVGVYRDEELVAVGQMGLQKLKWGVFWYCPRGLVMDYSDVELVQPIYAAVVKFYRRRSGAAYLRIDPNIVEDDMLASLVAQAAYSKPAAIFTQAERVWVAELQPNEDDLMTWLRSNGMRKKLPYYLRKTAKAGVEVRVSTDPDDLEVLIAMINDLNDRKGGIGKPQDEHYRRQFAAMAPKGYEVVCLATLDGKPLAASLMALYGREASYLHGASVKDHPELTAAHYLHIETMKWLARERPAIKLYNFWGIVGDKNRRADHPRNGYSEFKRSFGGYRVMYARGRDYIYKPIVWQVSWLLDKYRTWKYKND